MGLEHHPNPGSLVLCDYHGLKKPEMWKPARPTIIFTRPFRGRFDLCTVIPCSLSAPRKVRKYHHEFTLDQQLPSEFSQTMWAKCDMLYTLRLGRMRLIGDGYDHATGKRKYIKPMVIPDDFQAIKECVRFALGL